MRPPCSAVLAVAALLAVAAPSALAGNGSNEAIYTWVDAHGVRHYSDHPGSPNARLLSFTASGAALVKSEAPPASTPASPRHSPQVQPAPAPASMSPAARAARCSKLRAEIKRLQPAHRVKINENDASHYLSGADLVAFKQAMNRKMRRTCTPPH